MYNFNSFEKMESVVRSLVGVGDGKNLSSAWEILGDFVAQNENVELEKIVNIYEQIVDKWGDFLPTNLVRKEMKKGNYACVVGICLSDNTNIIKFVFVSLLKNNFFELKGFSKLLYCGGTKEIQYYKMLLYMLIRPNPNYNVSDKIDGWAPNKLIEDFICNLIKWVDFRLYFDDFLRLYFKNNSFAKKMLSKEIDGVLRNLQSESVYYENIYHYDWIYDPDFYEKESWGAYPIEYWLSMENILRDRLKEGCRILTKNKWTLNYGRRNSIGYFYTKLSIFLWIQNGIVPEIKSLLSKEYYVDDKENKIASVILSKPFFLSLSEDNLDFIESYFGFNFSKFIDENEDECVGILFEEVWRPFLQNFIESQAKSVKSIGNFNVSLPLTPEYEEYILSRTDDFFSTGIETLMFLEYKAFLNGCRENTIAKLVKKEYVSEIEQKKLLELTKKDDTNYYAWSDEELFSCFEEKKTEKQMELIHTELEPDFMSHVFEKSLCWVIFHKDSELWLTAPWIGMRIFSKSYADRPSIWAKHLVKLLKNRSDELSADMLVKICFALGHLREPLGNEVPIALQKCAEKQKDSRISDAIMRQRALFDRASFNKGHHKKAKRRVGECIEVLINGQNEEVGKILTKK